MRFLIADDHSVVREGLKQFLKTLSADTIIDEAVNGSEAWEMINGGVYDLVILDVSMPGMTGFDILKRLKDTGNSIRVLVLSIHPQEEYAFTAIRLGASGYISKDCAFEELKNAVRKITSGGRYLSPDLAEKMVFEGLQMPKTNLHEKLSKREFEIMIQLAEGKSVSEISRTLFLSKNTISTYRSRILGKMLMKRNTELTSYALRHKLIS